MADATFNMTKGATTARKTMLALLNVGTSSSSPTWAPMGISVEDSSNGGNLRGIADMAKAMSTVGQIKRLMSGKDPGQAVEALSKTNPQFAEFYAKNKDRAVNDILAEYGIDPEGFKSFLSMF